MPTKLLRSLFELNYMIYQWPSQAFSIPHLSFASLTGISTNVPLVCNCIVTSQSQYHYYCCLLVLTVRPVILAVWTNRLIPNPVNSGLLLAQPRQTTMNAIFCYHHYLLHHRHLVPLWLLLKKLWGKYSCSCFNLISLITV